MRAKTKKWFSPLFVLTLAVAGIFGVSAAVVDKQASDAPVVEKADAAAASGTHMYVDTRGFKGWQDSSANIGVYFYNSDSDNAFSDFTSSHTEGIYDIIVPGSGKNYAYCIVLRKNSSSSTKDWNNNWNRYPAENAGGMTIGSNNSIRITAWDTAVMITQKYVYCTNNKGWGNVYCHSWGGTYSSSWPGYKMSHVGSDGSNVGVYRVLVPSTVTSLVFDQGDSNAQTNDITGFTLNNLNGWWISGNSNKYTANSWTVGTVSSGDIIYLNYNALTWWNDAGGQHHYIFCFDSTDGVDAGVWSAEGHVFYEKGTGDRMIEFVVPGSGKHFLGLNFVRNSTATQSFAPCVNQSTNYYPGFVFTEGTQRNAVVISSNKYGEKSYYPDFVNTYILSNESRADFYGVYFNACMVCDGSGNIETDAWNDASTEYSAMPTAIQTIVKNKTGVLDGGDDHLATAVFRYDFILRKYGVGTTLPKHPNFMNRSVPKSSISSFSPYQLINEDGGMDSTVILIIVASSISILSVTALAVLMIKKKKSANK